jgi:competence protein ComEA
LKVLALRYWYPAAVSLDARSYGGALRSPHAHSWGVPTPAERQALLFIAAVAALGIGVRACRAVASPAGDRTARAALASQISQVDSAIASGGRSRSRVSAATPRPTDEAASAKQAAKRQNAGPATDSLPAGPIDVDIATAEELDRLPGIGPALAARIVEDRERNGPFGSLAGLDRVRGIGPALSERLRAHVTFSQSPRHHDTEVPAARRGRRRP